MSAKRLFVCVSTFGLLGLNPVLHAQDSMKVVIISPRVGPTLDAAERKYFHVFSHITGFTGAQFLLGADGTYYVRVSRIASPGGIETDTIMQYSEVGVLTMAEKINHLEELETGDYEMGSEPPHLEITDQAVGLHVAAQKPKADLSRQSKTLPRPDVPGPGPKPRSDMLPIGKDESAADIVLYPSYGIGVGIATYSPNLDETYRAVETYYAGIGYPLSPTSRDVSTSPILCLELYARFWDAIGLTFEAGLASYDTKIREVSALLLYYPEFLRTASGHLQPFVGIGIARYHFKSSRDYGQYISQYTTLDEVSIEGGKHGMNTRIGVEYAPGAVTHIQVFASYLAIPEVNAITREGIAPSVKLGGFQAGLQVIFHY